MFRNLFNRSKTDRVSPLTAPSSRPLRIESLEERALLSVGDAIIYGPVPWVEPADRPKLMSLMSASELAFALKTPELSAPPSLDAVVDEETDCFLDKLENSVSYSESEEVEALKPAIILYNGDDDGDHQQDNLDAFINYGDLEDVGELWVDKLAIQYSEIPADFKIELTLEESSIDGNYWGAFDPESRIRVFWPRAC